MQEEYMYFGTFVGVPVYTKKGFATNPNERIADRGVDFVEPTLKIARAKTLRGIRNEDVSDR